MIWSENSIARALALQTFKRQNLVLVPNCNWTGYECDLLVVTQDLRVIDVEVKISRADLRVDAKKDKWWIRKFTGYGPEERVEKDGRLIAIHRKQLYDETPRPWPPKVWKHYYAMPRDIWKPDMLEFCQPNSGVLLLHESKQTGKIIVECERRSTPNKDASKISAASAVDIARLASLRMWEAIETRDSALNAAKAAHEAATC